VESCCEFGVVLNIVPCLMIINVTILFGNTRDRELQNSTNSLTPILTTAHARLASYDLTSRCHVEATNNEYSSISMLTSLLAGHCLTAD
jgi:hypothetical protein